jgi:glycosyltransferase involved in cell wall biosynthesis
MTSPRYTFTVFTATYNRADTLHRVYDSLAAQTYRDFEWLICDDGSTDGTRELVEGWTAIADFPIRYVWQANRGKHVAINHGVQQARGELFLILDSDDACVPQALERFTYHWDRIPEAERADFSAVTALCMDPRGRLIGRPIPGAPVDSDFIEMRYRVKNRGERWGFHRTAVLREFPFPFVDEPAFCPEGLVWSAIARRYKTRYVNEPLRIYHAHERPDQLTARDRGMRHATVLAAWHRCVMNDHFGWFRRAPAEFLRSGVHFIRFSLHRGGGLRSALGQLRAPGPRLIALLALPLGVGIYLRDRAMGARRPVPRADRSKAAGRP